MLTAKLSDIIMKDRIRKNLQNIKSFANSLQEYGVIQPVVVKRLSNRKYELVAGQRRYEAAKYLGWKEIPITFNNSKAVNPIFIEVAENEDRANFTMTERHEALQRIKEIRAKSKQEEGVQIAHPYLKGKKSRDLAARLNNGGSRTRRRKVTL
jgi:ParB family transcriptional regulator, chromosome partitioning protein